MMMRSLLAPPPQPPSPPALLADHRRLAFRAHDDAVPRKLERPHVHRFDARLRRLRTRMRREVLLAGRRIIPHRHSL